MPTWIDIYAAVRQTLLTADKNVRFFRGHSDSAWRLVPGIARVNSPHRHLIEKAYLFQFVNRGSPFLSENTYSWANAFAMQHHGLPTRLLDWSESFGVALFFAMREGVGDAAVWILDPYELNTATIGRPQLLDADDLNGSYWEFFIQRSKTLPGDAVALTPPARLPRVLNQRGGFTLHSDLERSLDEIAPNALTKITIPAACRDDAAIFLAAAGISEFSMFPDLDGLARELRSRYE